MKIVGFDCIDVEKKKCLAPPVNVNLRQETIL